MPELGPAHDLCAYIDASPSPFHAVAETVRRLEAAGFTELRELDEWTLRPGGKHYVTRADASVVAFRVGDRSPVETGFRIVGAHTDSPNLRLKPNASAGKEGYAQLGVEIYGGVLPGNYYVDEAGNWVNVDNPAHAGNFYRDAQAPRGGGGSGGLTRTPFGDVGDGYYFDPESGVSIGP